MGQAKLKARQQSFEAQALQAADHVIEPETKAAHEGGKLELYINVE